MFGNTNHLFLEEKDGKYRIQADDESQFALYGEWELGPENESGWRSVNNVQTGEYLTATSLNTLTFRGMAS